MNINLNWNLNLFVSVQMEEWARESDWVGAWWLGFLICGIFSIILAFSIFMLPSSLPGVQDPPGDQVTVPQYSPWGFTLSYSQIIRLQ